MQVGRAVRHGIDQDDADADLQIADAFRNELSASFFAILVGRANNLDGGHERHTLLRIANLDFELIRIPRRESEHRGGCDFGSQCQTPTRVSPIAGVRFEFEFGDIGFDHVP